MTCTLYADCHCSAIVFGVLHSPVQAWQCCTARGGCQGVVGAFVWRCQDMLPMHRASAMLQACSQLESLWMNQQTR